MKKSKYYGMLFLLLAQTMVGINIVASKYLLTSIPVLLLLLMRFALAAAILLPLHWLTPARQVPVREHFAQLNSKDWTYFFAQALTAGVLFNCLMIPGLYFTDANVAGIITSALPAIIALLSWIVLGEQISSKTGLCISFATVGLLIIACDKFIHAPGEHSALGDLLVFLSLIPEASYYILCKVHPNTLPVFLVSGLINAINMLCLLPVLLFIHWDPSNFDQTSWLVMLILGLSSGLFYTFWYFGYQRAEGFMASISTAMMPIATVIFAWLFLQEDLSSLEFAGMSLVILSIVAYAY